MIQQPGPAIDCGSCRNQLRRRNSLPAIDCDVATVPSQSFTITGLIATSQWSCNAPVMHYRSCCPVTGAVTGLAMLQSIHAAHSSCTASHTHMWDCWSRSSHSSCGASLAGPFLPGVENGSTTPFHTACSMSACPALRRSTTYRHGAITDGSRTAWLLPCLLTESESGRCPTFSVLYYPPSALIASCATPTHTNLMALSTMDDHLAVHNDANSLRSAKQKIPAIALQATGHEQTGVGRTQSMPLSAANTCLRYHQAVRA